MQARRVEGLRRMQAAIAKPVGPMRRVEGIAKGVGDAVNEAVVITFTLLFVVNFVISALYLQLVPPKGM